MYFEHDSWDTFYKDPFGAIPIDTEVTFRVRSEDTVNIELHTNFMGIDQFYPMQKLGDSDTYEVTIKTPDVPGLLWYDFHFDTFNSHYVFGANPDGIGGKGQVNLFNTNSYQITVYNPERKVPDWYKGATRFRVKSADTAHEVF